MPLTTVSVPASAAADTDFDPGGLNRRLFLDVNDFARHTPWLHGAVYVYATFGVLVFGALLVAGWWRARADADPARIAAALWAPPGTLLAIALTHLVASAVAGPHPYAGLPHTLVLADRNAGPSFPSDHAIMAGAVAAALFLVSRRLGAIAAIGAAAMAFSGVYLAAHYPYDVTAGLLLGAIIVVVGHALLDDALIRMVQHLATSPLRPLVCESETDAGGGAPGAV
jgi:membrane-associated phospholipid phosphatase